MGWCVVGGPLKEEGKEKSEVVASTLVLRALSRGSSEYSKKLEEIYRTLRLKAQPHMMFNV